MNILIGLFWLALLASGLVFLLVCVSRRDERILDERRIEREREAFEQERERSDEYER